MNTINIVSNVLNKYLSSEILLGVTQNLPWSSHQSVLHHQLFVPEMIHWHGTQSSLKLSTGTR